MRAAVSVRSLNHRFLDVALHVPRRLQSLEPEVRERVGRAIKRGRVEVVVQAVVPGGDGEGVLPSRALVSALVRALRELQAEFGLDGGVSVSDILRFPGALERLETAGELAAAVREQVLALLGSALAKLDEMRGAEGARLEAELARALDVIEAATARIETRSAECRDERRTALRERVRGAPRRPRPRRRTAPPGGGARGRAPRRGRGGGAPAQPRHRGAQARPRGRRRAGGQAARLPRPGADARGQHDRQQGAGRGRGRRRSWSSRRRSSASASRCRTLSDREPAVIVVSAPSGRREDERRRARPRRDAGHPLLRLVHHAPRRAAPSATGSSTTSWTASASSRCASGAPSSSGPRCTGTCTAPVSRRSSAPARPGCDLLLDLDVQGAAQVRRRIEDAVTVFVLPPSYDVLERRLRGRGEDDEAAIRRRLAAAGREIDAFAQLRLRDRERRPRPLRRGAQEHRDRRRAAACRCVTARARAIEKTFEPVKETETT